MKMQIKFFVVRAGYCALPLGNCTLICGSSSFGRAIAFQAIGGEFEPRLPLFTQLSATAAVLLAVVAQW